MLGTVRFVMIGGAGRSMESSFGGVSLLTDRAVSSRRATPRTRQMANPGSKALASLRGIASTPFPRHP